MRINELMQQIEVLQNKEPTSQNLSNEKLLHSQIKEELKRKEMIWLQKSREMWLKDGDANTKFFHLSTIIDRKQNSITSIKIDRDRWIYNPYEIGNYFEENFKTLLQTSNPIIPDDLEQLISPIITEEDNQLLNKIPTIAEIENIVKSMNSLKSPGPDGMPALFYKKILEYNKRRFHKSYPKFLH